MWSWAKHSNPRGSTTWEACWLSCFLSASSLASSQNYVSSNTDWLYLPVLVGRGEEIAAAYICRIRERKMSSCEAAWGTMVNNRKLKYWWNSSCPWHFR